MVTTIGYVEKAETDPSGNITIIMITMKLDL